MINKVTKDTRTVYVSIPSADNARKALNISDPKDVKNWVVLCKGKY